MSRSLPFTSGMPAPAPVFNQGLPKIFQSTSARKFSFRDRLKNKNRIAIVPDRFFNRDRDRDENPETGDRLLNEQDGPVIWEKLRLPGVQEPP
jgi:hypothetical protein